jgi:hypothetical protein
MVLTTNNDIFTLRVWVRCLTNIDVWVAIVVKELVRVGALGSTHGNYICTVVGLLEDDLGLLCTKIREEEV